MFESFGSLLTGLYSMLVLWIGLLLLSTTFSKKGDKDAMFGMQLFAMSAFSMAIIVFGLWLVDQWFRM